MTIQTAANHNAHVTFYLKNGGMINMSKDMTNVANFLNWLLEKGQEMDTKFTSDAQIIGFNVTYRFKPEVLLPE